MVRTLVCGLSTLVLLWVAVTASAQQQVTLETGATLVGNVSMDGENLLIDVDGAKLRVPFKDVATVTSSATDSSSQAQRLLFRGLEAQLLYGGEEKEIGLLAEAYRLAPDDPRVAYWYARSLANAGYGKGANEVFKAHRAAIAVDYPGFGDRLAKQIKERLVTESLPESLVKRLDQIAAAADRAGPLPAEKRAYAAYFQLVDQNGGPIADSAFRINCNVEDENLESFRDGYHLFTFSRRSSYHADPCRLEVSQVGLVSKTFEFRGATNRAEDAGVFRVKRLSDSDRLLVVVTAVDAQGVPLSGATVSFNAMSQRGDDNVPSSKSSAEGRAEAQLFPGSYTCQASLDGYNASAQPVTVAPDEKRPIEVEVKLYRAISATAKVVWRAKLTFQPGRPEFQNDAVTTGEFELHAGPGAAADYGRSATYGPPWVRLMQTGNKMQLQFMEQMYYPQPSSGATWVGRVENAPETPREGATESPTTAAFEEIDLSKLDEMKDKLKLPRPNLGGMPGRPNPLSLPVEVGAIYVGKINSRDPQTGRPAVFEFKILTTELSRR